MTLDKNIKPAEIKHLDSQSLVSQISHFTYCSKHFRKNNKQVFLLQNLHLGLNCFHQYQIYYIEIFVFVFFYHNDVKALYMINNICKGLARISLCDYDAKISLKQLKQVKCS